MAGYLVALKVYPSVDWKAVPLGGYSVALKVSLSVDWKADLLAELADSKAVH